MSRHRRQRNRRFQRALERVPQSEVDAANESCSINGHYPRWAYNRPLILIAAKRQRNQYNRGYHQVIATRMGM